MKFDGIFYVILSTVLLVSITIMVVMDLPFNWVFYLTMLGQAVFLFAVYKVLTDEYTTEKTFDHWYEDKPEELNY
jgi:uncharacterized membrane protein